MVFKILISKYLRHCETSKRQSTVTYYYIGSGGKCKEAEKKIRGKYQLFPKSERVDICLLEV